MADGGCLRVLRVVHTEGDPTFQLRPPEILWAYGMYSDSGDTSYTIAVKYINIEFDAVVVFRVCDIESSISTDYIINVETPGIFEWEAQLPAHLRSCTVQVRMQRFNPLRTGVWNIITIEEDFER